MLIQWRASSPRFVSRVSPPSAPAGRPPTARTSPPPAAVGFAFPPPHLSSNHFTKIAPPEGPAPPPLSLFNLPASATVTPTSFPDASTPTLTAPPAGV